MNTSAPIWTVFQSRKFWMAAIGLILVLVASWGQDPYPTDAVVTAIMGVVAAYIGSVALEDGMRAKAEAQPMTKIETPAENVDVGTTGMGSFDIRTGRD